jgi:hypothetical protein
MEAWRLMRLLGAESIQAWSEVSNDKTFEETDHDESQHRFGPEQRALLRIRCCVSDVWMSDPAVSSNLVALVGA